MTHRCGAPNSFDSTDRLRSATCRKLVKEPGARCHLHRDLYPAESIRDALAEWYELNSNFDGPLIPRKLSFSAYGFAGAMLAEFDIRRRRHDEPR